MSRRPDLWSALEPAYLPQYSHTAVIVGSAIIVAITVLAPLAAHVFVVSRGRMACRPPPSQAEYPAGDHGDQICPITPFANV